MALKDHGVRRTGKEAASNRAMVGGAGLCGPDQHAVGARIKMEQLNKADQAARDAGKSVDYDFRERDKLYGQMNRLEKRKNRGGQTFGPKDCC